MKYEIEHFKSITTGRIFHRIASWADGDMEEDWRVSVTSCITGEPLLAMYYPTDVGSPSFSARVNKRLHGDEYRDIISLEWGTDDRGFRITTKFNDVFDPSGYSIKIGASTVAEFEQSGGRYTVEGNSIR